MQILVFRHGVSGKIRAWRGNRRETPVSDERFEQATDEQFAEERAALGAAVKKAEAAPLNTSAIVAALLDGPQVVRDLRVRASLPVRDFHLALDSLWRGGLIDVSGSGEDAKVSLTETGAVVAEYA